MPDQKPDLRKLKGKSFDHEAAGVVPGRHPSFLKRQEMLARFTTVSTKPTPPAIPVEAVATPLPNPPPPVAMPRKTKRTAGRKTTK